MLMWGLYMYTICKLIAGPTDKKKSYKQNYDRSQKRLDAYLISGKWRKK